MKDMRPSRVPRESFAWIRKTLCVTSLVGVLAFGLVACAPSAAPDSFDRSADPVAPTQSSEEVVEEEEPVGVAGCVDVTVSGDVIPGELASNSSGEYCTVVINPESAALVYDQSKVDPALFDLGYTNEQLENMQKQAVKTVVEKLLDNPYMGEPSSQLKEWVTKESPDFFRQELIDASIKETDKKIKIYDVYAGSYISAPPAVYDGGARFTQVTVNIESINIRKPDDSNDTSAATDAEVSLSVNFTERINPSVYNEWKTSLLHNLNYSEYVEYVEKEEFDREEPSFFDVNKSLKIGYSSDDIREAGELKVRSISSRIPDIIQIIPYN